MMNILICMQQMGIGGVETVVLNQIQLLKKKNYNVFVIGKYGTYTQKYKEYGAKCIEFDFKLQKYYDKETLKDIEKTIKEHNINAMYIHSSECIPYVFPLCVHYNIPYVAYIHGGYKEVYEWYINNYYIFKIYFPLYFKNAYKNVSITNKAKDNIIEMFKLESDENFVINPNSIDFNNVLENNSEKNNKTKLLILSRLSKEKEQSIINAIDFYKKYVQVLPEASLSIVGTGNAEDEIKEYVNKLDLDEKVEFLGESNDIYSIIKDYDIVLAMGRGILEAIAMKKIAIISGYKKLMGIVKENNIQNACDENFTDRFKQENENVLEELTHLTKSQIKKIVNNNYKFCYEKCNAEKNFIYFDMQHQTIYKDVMFDEFLSFSCKLANFYEKEIVKRDETIEEIYKTNVLLKEQVEMYKKEKETNEKADENITEEQECNNLIENIQIKDEDFNANEEDNQLNKDLETKNSNRRGKCCLKLLDKIKKTRK